MKAIITGYDGSEDDLRAFVTAWRLIKTGRTSDPATGTNFLAVPPPALWLVPAAEHA